MYMESLKVLGSEISRANETILKQIQEDLDRKLKDIDQLCLELAWNPRVSSFVLEKTPISSDGYYNIYKMLHELRIYKATNEFIFDFYIYYKNSDVVLSSNSRLDSRRLYDIIHKNQSNTYDEWMEILRSKHSRDLMPVVIKKNYETYSNAIAYIRTIPMESPLESDACIIIVVDEEKLLEYIKNVPWANDGTVIVIDNSNNIIASTRPIQTKDFFKGSGLEGEKGLVHREINGERAEVSYISSMLSDWKYVSIIPTRVFWARMEYVHSLTIITIVLCFLIGGVVVYFLVKKNYNPVNKLIESLAKSAGTSFEKDYNEYRFINEAISSTIEEKEEVGRRLKQQRNAFRSNFLIRLLKGEIDDKIPIDESMASYEINFDSDYFAVLLFYIEDLDAFLPEDNKPGSSDRFKLAHFIITNVVEELLSRDNNCFTAELDGMLACIVNFRQDRLSSSREDITNALLEAKQFVGDKFHIKYATAVSYVHQSIAGIPIAYREAVEIMEYKVVLGYDNANFPDDIQNLHKKDYKYSYYYPLVVEQQLINCLKIGDDNGAKAIIDEVFKVNITDLTMTVDLARCLMFNLVSTLIKAREDIENIYGNRAIESTNPIESIINCETTKEMKKRIIDSIDVMCQFVKCNKKEPNNNLSDTVINFIESNFYDTNMNISMIANRFNMSPPYISRLFKEQTGEGLLDCISRVRMERAKEFMKNKELHIAEIARQVGYSDINTFIRVFKKYEGITPGRFKEII